MAKWTRYYKIVTPATQIAKMTDSRAMTDVGAYNNYTWVQRLLQGSASRLIRYREFDLCDNDVEVARALDTIAEEMIGSTARGIEPIMVDVLTDVEEHISATSTLTVKAAVRRWSEIHDWENKLFHVCRMTVKYGDVFFKKEKNFTKWTFVHPKNVVAALVDKHNITKIIAWQIKKDIEDVQSGGYGNAPLGGKMLNNYDTEIVLAQNMVRFTLSDDMDDTQPFGESILRPVYRAHKQKELLEDAIIIYRIQRAPERRVFYIDVGKMPPQRVKAYLESIKNEMKQKKIPTIHGGQSEVDSVYNPQSMSEDWFIAARPDGRGTRVETLPGGQGLGELEDLYYFQKKVWRGLRVPTSYMIDPSEGGATWNDGRVGTAYIQELRFALFIQRLQGAIERTLDKEFKMFLKRANIYVSETTYKLRLPPPTNFGKYRQLELDGQLLGMFGSADAIPYLSKRFAMRKYLQMSDEDLAENEFMLREERGLSVTNTEKDMTSIYGMVPGMEGAMGGAMGGGASGIGGGMIGGGFGGLEMGMEAGGMPGEGGEGGEPNIGGGIGGEEAGKETPAPAKRESPKK